MKYESTDPEYQPYTPGMVDEDGNDVRQVDWEKQRDRTVQFEIKRNGRAKGRLALAGHHGLSKQHVYAIRRRFDPEFRRRQQIKERLVIGSVVLVFGGIAVGGLVAAINESNNPPSLKDEPVDRFEHDYIDDQSDCLYKSAWDTGAGNRGKLSVSPPSHKFDSETGILTITPVSGEDELQLTGFDQNSHTLAPVGEEDKDIFSSKGCEVENY